ncbi:MAG TPA: alpha/beta fold hydrolase [Kofleriaceae bacterium]|nr:alpha/beta fold hydrolase [Kofleriaceae bacterium]
MTVTVQDAHEPGGSPAEPSILPLVAADGARSEGRLFAPAGAARAVALCLPAMGVEASYYDPFVRALAAGGVASLTVELRGNGSSSLRAGRGVDFGYRELVELDVGTALAAARERLPGPPIVLVGHSLGGHLAVLRAAMHPDEVAGIALIAAGTPYFRAYPGARQAYLLAGSLALRGLSAALGYLPGRTVGFGGREARRLIAEWAHVARLGRFEFLGAPANLPAAMAAVRLPVLALSMAEDVLAPRNAVDHLAGMLPGAALTTRHTARGELGDGIDHFRWVRRPERIAAIVTDWIAGL